MSGNQHELKTFVGLFVDPIPIASANSNEFGFVKHPMTATWVRAAIEGKYLEWFGDDEGPIVDSNALFVRELLITDAGRKLCGIPIPVVKEEPKSKKQSKTLF